MVPVTLPLASTTSIDTGTGLPPTVTTGGVPVLTTKYLEYSGTVLAARMLNDGVVSAAFWPTTWADWPGTAVTARRRAVRLANGTVALVAPPAVPCVSRMALASVPLAPGVRMIVRISWSTKLMATGVWKRTSLMFRATLLAPTTVM